MKEQLLAVWEVFQESLRVRDPFYDTIQLSDFSRSLHEGRYSHVAPKAKNSNERPVKPVVQAIIYWVLYLKSKLVNSLVPWPFLLKSPGLIRALEVYSPNHPAADKWRSGLRPLSIYQQNQLQKAVRDYTKLYSVQHTPPQTTLSVRWRNHGSVTCYSKESLLKIFSHFGPVRKISFQSECSAHVVLENVESACAALSLSNLGFPSSPLHVRWLAEERKMLVWRRKDAVAKPSSNSERKTGCKGPNKTIVSKGRRFRFWRGLVKYSAQFTTFGNSSEINAWQFIDNF